jgi:hypothetical protein
VRLATGIKRLGDRKGHREVLLVANTGSSGKTAKSQQRATLALRQAHKHERLPRRERERRDGWSLRGSTRDLSRPMCGRNGAQRIR